MSEPLPAARLAEIRAMLATPESCTYCGRGRATHEWYDGGDQAEHMLCESCAEDHDCSEDVRLSDHQTPERDALADLLAEVDRLRGELLDRDRRWQRLVDAVKP